MKANPTEVGQRIRQYRKEKGLTMVNLGKLIQAPQSAISNWEKGDNLPNVERLSKLAEIFEITVDDLLQGSFPEQVSFQFNELWSKYSQNKFSDFLEGSFDLTDYKMTIYEVYLNKIYSFKRNNLNDSNTVSFEKIFVESIKEVYKSINDNFGEQLKNKIFDIMASPIFGYNDKKKYSELVSLMANVFEEIDKITEVNQTFDNKLLISSLKNKFKEIHLD